MAAARRLVRCACGPTNFILSQGFRSAMRAGHEPEPLTGTGNLLTASRRLLYFEAPGYKVNERRSSETQHEK